MEYASASASPEPSLIGRERERALLWSQYQAAASGQTHVVLIEGQPGIGKTCLLDAMAAHARQQGVPVLRGGASEAEGMPPYLPFLEALGQHIRTATPNIVLEQAGAMASVLATILPEFPLPLGELPVSCPLPAEQARLRLYEAVGMFLAAISVPDALLLLPDEAMVKAHALCDMAAILTWMEDLEWVAHLYPRLIPFHGQMHAFSMDRLLGALATLLGDFPAARMYLEAAEEATRQSSFKVELAFTLLAQANLELAEHRRSGVASVRVLLEEALVLSEQVGTQAFERYLRERLHQLAGKGTRPHLPAGLSPREAEVLRLVTQGKSNREIAEELVISERTVANHLASIFNKTGVENRAAAAAFAIRHELAE